MEAFVATFDGELEEACITVSKLFWGNAGFDDECNGLRTSGSRNQLFLDGTPICLIRIAPIPANLPTVILHFAVDQKPNDWGMSEIKFTPIWNNCIHLHVSAGVWRGISSLTDLVNIDRAHRRELKVLRIIPTIRTLSPVKRRRQSAFAADGNHMRKTSYKKGQAQRLTDMVISVNFVDCSDSLFWGSYCDDIPFSTC